MAMRSTPGPGMVQLTTALKELDKIRTRVGWFESAKYEDGTPVAYVASIQEFGVAERSIPPRPTMRPTIEAQTTPWQGLMANGTKAAIAGRVTGKQVMEGLGLQAAGDVRAAIASLTSPPLSEVTLLLRKRKKEGAIIGGKAVGQAFKDVKAKEADVSGVSTKPLVEDGLLLATLTSNVENK